MLEEINRVAREAERGGGRAAPAESALSAQRQDESGPIELAPSDAGGGGPPADRRRRLPRRARRQRRHPPTAALTQ